MGDDQEDDGQADQEDSTHLCAHEQEPEADPYGPQDPSTDCRPELPEHPLGDVPGQGTGDRIDGALRLLSGQGIDWLAGRRGSFGVPEVDDMAAP